MESKFTGSLLGLIGINILAAIITIFTLGIGLPWAICVKQNWLTKYTIIDGNTLYFDGNGAQLFGNWIKWFFLTIITFGIYGFWVTLKLRHWVTKHTHMVANRSSIKY